MDTDEDEITQTGHFKSIGICWFPLTGECSKNYFKDQCFKVWLSPSKKAIFICLYKNLLKMMKNLFYFILKALFVLQIIKFSSWRFGYVEKNLIKKLGLFSKFMTSQTGQKIIAIHILPNISRGKSKQTMKLGQIIEYSMRNIFLKKSYRNVLEKLVQDPFISISGAYLEHISR